MPKPPTSQRGRPARAPLLPPPPPARRPWLRRFVAGSADSAGQAGSLAPEGSAAQAVAARRVPRPAGRGDPASPRGSAPELARRDAAVATEGSDDAASWAAGLDVAPAEPRRGLLGLVDAAGWRALVTTLLCLAGLGVSIYLTIAHYAHYVLACPANSTFNCEAVTHSPESYVFGIPVAVLGLAYFVPMLALCSPWAWRSPNRLVAPLRVAGTFVSVGFVFYLVYSELFVIGSICVWCSSVHAISLALFILVATGWNDATAARITAESAAGTGLA